MATVIERVDRLEVALERFIDSVGIEFNKLYNSQLRTEAELREFKEEMREFKDEMREFKEEMREFKDEMREFKEEMREFKDEMREFKEENRRQTRTMNRQWGELSNRLGTLVEDLVYPSLPRIIRETLGREVLDHQLRRKRKLADGRVKEFDAIAVTEDLVGLNGTKATLRSEDVDRFVEDIATFREFYPEYRALPVVGILATLAVEESVLNYVERRGFLVIAVGDEIMEVKNRPGFEPKRW
jgi:predicted RNase H-like nuclease (RuvC/YqgF family)